MSVSALVLLQVKSIAQAMVDNGMLALGYDHVNLDDW